jgi:uncharacterized membrane protein (DUF2068 family)
LFCVSLADVEMDKQMNQTAADPKLPDASARSSSASARGVRLLATYKLLRGTIQLVAALLLLLALARTHGAMPDTLNDIVQFLVHHATPRWSAKIAGWALSLETGHGHTLVWGAVALLADGVMTLVEGFALHLHKAWGEWLVVLTTGSPLPLELAQLFRHPSIGHVLLLVGNAAVVGFLVWRRLRVADRAAD